jgi:hypothetical protein
MSRMKIRYGCIWVCVVLWPAEEASRKGGGHRFESYQPRSGATLYENCLTFWPTWRGWVGSWLAGGVPLNFFCYSFWAFFGAGLKTSMLAGACLHWGPILADGHAPTMRRFVLGRWWALHQAVKTLFAVSTNRLWPSGPYYFKLVVSI